MGINRIVLIDDCETDNIFHEMVLATADFEGDLKIFDSPSSGIQYLKTQPDGPVDLVFLDVNMPAIDGWGVLAALQDDLPKWPDMQIVMLTSSSAQEDLGRARSIPGVAGYMTKPLEPDTTRQLLQGQLAGQLWRCDEGGEWSPIGTRNRLL